MKRIEKEKEKTIIDLYSQGFSCKKISELINLNTTTIFNVLKRNNIPLRSKGGKSNLPIAEIVNDYQSGVSTTILSHKYNLSIKGVCNILEQNGIERNNRYKNLNLKLTYFDQIDSLDKAYFLGLLFTDGSIGNKTNTISISQKSENSYILDLFDYYIGNENKRSYDVRVRNDEVFIYQESLFKSKYMKETLINKYGILPGKSYKKIHLPTIDIDFMNAFIRGLIDGDGWISYKSNSIGFCGNEYAVSDLRSFFVNNLKCANNKIIKTNDYLFSVTWSNNSDIEKIGSFIYHDKDRLYLKSKYKNYKKIIASKK